MCVRDCKRAKSTDEAVGSQNKGLGASAAGTLKLGGGGVQQKGMFVRKRREAEAAEQVTAQERERSEAGKVNPALMRCTIWAVKLEMTSISGQFRWVTSCSYSSLPLKPD